VSGPQRQGWATQRSRNITGDRRNIRGHYGVFISVEVDATPRPLGLVIVAIIAAVLWSLVAPNLGADHDGPSSTAPSAVVVAD